MDCAQSGFGSMRIMGTISGIALCFKRRTAPAASARSVVRQTTQQLLLLHQRNKLVNRGTARSALSLNVHEQQLVRAPHLNRAAANALNVVRNGENGQRLVGVEVEIVHGAAVTQVAQDQMLLRSLLIITLLAHAHSHQVEQIDLARLRADGHVPRSARAEVHAHHGGIHLQRDDGRGL